MKEADTRIIEGTPFSVTPFMFFKAQKLQLRVLKIISPVVGELFGMVGDDVESFDLNNIKLEGDTISRSLAKLFELLDEDTYEDLIKTIFSSTSATIKDKDGRDITVTLQNNLMFDEVFGTNTTKLFKAIQFVAEVNFPTFFEKFRGIGSKIAETTTSLLAENLAKSE